MSAVVIGGRVFRRSAELIEVTGGTVPDLAWSYTDPNGHVHRWVVAGETEAVPTATIVKVGEYEDGGSILQYECWLCRSVIHPRRLASTEKRFKAGIADYSIDDISMSKEEYIRELKDACEKAGIPWPNS